VRCARYRWQAWLLDDDETDDDSDDERSCGDENDEAAAELDGGDGGAAPSGHLANVDAAVGGARGLVLRWPARWRRCAGAAAAAVVHVDYARDGATALTPPVEVMAFDFEAPPPPPAPAPAPAPPPAWCRGGAVGPRAPRALRDGPADAVVSWWRAEMCRDGGGGDGGGGGGELGEQLIMEVPPGSSPPPDHWCVIFVICDGGPARLLAAARSLVRPRPAGLERSCVLDTQAAAAARMV